MSATLKQLFPDFLILGTLAYSLNSIVNAKELCLWGLLLSKIYCIKRVKMFRYQFKKTKVIYDTHQVVSMRSSYLAKQTFCETSGAVVRFQKICCVCGVTEESKIPKAASAFARWLYCAEDATTAVKEREWEGSDTLVLLLSQFDLPGTPERANQELPDHTAQTAGIFDSSFVSVHHIPHPHPRLWEETTELLSKLTVHFVSAPEQMRTAVAPQHW